ncbi:hypothetical protein BDK51DRAFT_46923 [Blyttiomyces helicus]|uniref:MCM N-terminal domain-containing protein n=1 Tax=Blyttiomyces helicus TaxID=388810 RepID=A0A4P9W2S2_9FUNG|nr:hypothetical protein BDK51DRAFT_46923 [Blyttiomyces helicus]|eukprot:RKO86454.1 hypothetical protein BDK51DRAFT_46923 [Blyttiomyces helicus]
MLSAHSDQPADSDHLRTDGPIPTSDGARRASQAQPRPNPVALNLLDDPVEKVTDTTAEQVRADFEKFLESFVDEETGENYYIAQIKAMREQEVQTIYVDFAHLLAADDLLAETIMNEFYR